MLQNIIQKDYHQTKLQEAVLAISSIVWFQ